MTGLKSRLFSSISSIQPPNNPPSRNFSVRTSPKDANVTFVHHVGDPIEAPPLYSIVTLEGLKQSLLVYRGIPHPHPRSMIGNANFHSFPSTTDLNLRGEPIPMKMNQLSGNLSLEHYPFGKLRWKWKLDRYTGTGLELTTASGSKLAQLKSAGIHRLREKRLEVLVVCDERFVELVVLSAMAAKTISKAQVEVGSEVAGAAAGA
ncbi:hypothetical protein BU16DRAFT_562027 [Lophium mytilinum]|uniref:Uncharacterized protein n=1 Tax=Lophium mytilinum TaxID=390894 RepID=A0A6A6QTX8_9PEZI|nr:hypothetical protein BU16DRAFT_562027 [Lophium mytilinum]